MVAVWQEYLYIRKLKNKKKDLLLYFPLPGWNKLADRFWLKKKKKESAKEFHGLTLILLHQKNWLQQKASCCGLAQSPKSALWHHLQLQELGTAWDGIPNCTQSRGWHIWPYGERRGFISSGCISNAAEARGVMLGVLITCSSPGALVVLLK